METQPGGREREREARKNKKMEENTKKGHLGKHP